MFFGGFPEGQFSPKKKNLRNFSDVLFQISGLEIIDFWFPRGSRTIAADPDGRAGLARGSLVLLYFVLLCFILGVLCMSGRTDRGLDHPGWSKIWSKNLQIRRANGSGRVRPSLPMGTERAIDL